MEQSNHIPDLHELRAARPNPRARLRIVTRSLPTPIVHGPRADAEALFGEVAAVLSPMGLRLSQEKTHLTHIEDGFDFLGWRIQRLTWQGRSGLKQTVYTYPSKKSLASIRERSGR